MYRANEDNDIAGKAERSNNKSEFQFKRNNSNSKRRAEKPKIADP